MIMKRFIALLLTILMLMGTSVYTTKTYATESPNALNFRGMWVSTVLNLDYPLHATSDEDALKAQADAILDGAQDLGMNAIILQV